MTDGSTSSTYLPYPYFGAQPSLRDKMVASRVFGTKELEAPTMERYGKVLRPLCELCLEKGITNIPKVMIAKSKVQNASLTGEGTMLISDGLTETLSETEMRAVIMHELEHYQKKEITSVIGHAMGFVADFAIGLFGGRAIEHYAGTHFKHPALQRLAAHGVPTLATHYLVFAPAHAYFQHRNEYEADLEGAKTVGFDNMIGVLRYFDELYTNRHEQIPSNVVKRIMDKGILGNIATVIFPFDDHPTFKDRIARLEKERPKYPDSHVSQVQAEQHKLIAPSTLTLQ